MRSRVRTDLESNPVRWRSCHAGIMVRLAAVSALAAMAFAATAAERPRISVPGAGKVFSNTPSPRPGLVVPSRGKNPGNKSPACHNIAGTIVCPPGGPPPVHERWMDQARGPLTYCVPAAGAIKATKAFPVPDSLVTDEAKMGWCGANGAGAAKYAGAYWYGWCYTCPGGVKANWGGWGLHGWVCPLCQTSAYTWNPTKKQCCTKVP